MTHSRAAIIDGLWRRHSLSYALHRDQRAIREQYLKAQGRVFVLCCSRRWGKSRLGAALAIEKAISQEKAHIKYAAPTMKMAREIVVPHMEELLGDCPEEMKPAFNKSELSWSYPNGSRVLLAGCDSGNAERLRGTSMDMGICDEAGFIDDLRYVVKSILMPQMMTTGGRIFMPSTPAKSPVHDFTDYCLEAEAAGRYAHRTIYDAPHISANIAAEFMVESGGEESSDWKREYLAQVVVDEDSAVLPEFTRNADAIIQELEIPTHRKILTSIDVGFHDLTAALFGYYDFEAAALCVEDERIFQHAHSGIIAPAVLAAERSLWGEREPDTRVVDADAVVRADLSRDHGLSCRLPKKDDKHAAINALRTAIANGRLKVHPRCTNLIAHCKGAVWNRSRNSFERSGMFGHFDAVDALVYMWRHADKNTNPFPRFRQGETLATHWIKPEEDPAHALAEVMKPPKRRR